MKGVNGALRGRGAFAIAFAGATFLSVALAGACSSSNPDGNGTHGGTGAAAGRDTNGESGGGPTTPRDFDAGDDAGPADGMGANGGAANGGAAASAGGAATGAPNGTDGGSKATGGDTAPAGYRLSWSDEFDVDGAPNPANWSFENGFVRNNEAQWYQSDNARVEAGFLTIEARREHKPNPKYVAGSTDWKTRRQFIEYTSASLSTRVAHTFQFGRFELRARIDTQVGMWPAWWTLGVSGEWPSNGEIDIMEFYQSKVLANIACGTSTRYKAKWNTKSIALSALGREWPESFHVWRMDWDDQRIALYLDDKQVNAASLSDMLNPDGKSPFRQKVYMILNLAIGGDNGGSPDATAFPRRYVIDYVRVYQKDE